LWKRLVGAALVAQHGAAQNVNVGRLLRFACSQLVIERTDPLVNPGMNPSTHVHQIVGGNSFNVTVRRTDIRTSLDISDTDKSADGPQQNGPIRRVHLHDLHVL